MCVHVFACRYVCVYTCIHVYYFYVLPCSTRSPSSPRHGWLNSLRTDAGFQTRLCIHTIISERACIIIIMAITYEGHAPSGYNFVVNTPAYRWLTPFLPKYFLCVSDAANFFPLIVLMRGGQALQKRPFFVHSSVSLQLSACWHGRRVGLLTRDH